MYKQFATDQYILAHVDIARRVERHGGCGCRGMLGVVLGFAGK
jgi:hypothetical protein